MSKGGGQPPIIVIKKVSGGGHHGGAWKVAYADFVTAMMALFIVLWLMNASPEIQKAVSMYFNDPKGFSELEGTGTVGVHNNDAAMLLNKEDMPDLKKKLSETLRQMPELGALKEQVDMTVTGDGLRIELIDKEKNSFFESGAKEMTATAKVIVNALAKEIGKLENPIVIEGHTDSRPFSSSGYYNNWDLSTDRANSARRFMEQHGVRQNQVVQLRGFADRHLRNAKDPTDFANRRVSIIVGFVDKPGTKAPPAQGNAEGEHGKSGEDHAAAGDGHEKAEGEHDKPKEGTAEATEAPKPSPAH